MSQQNSQRIEVLKEKNENAAVKDTMKNGWTLFTLNTLAALQNMDFGLPAAFFPVLAKQRGFDATATAIIFAAFPLFYFLGFTYFSNRLAMIDRKKILLWTIILGSFFKLSFGSLEYVENSKLFLTIALISRSFVGLTSAMSLSIILSLISEIWPEDKIRKVALFDTVSTVGYAAGPWAGSLFYYIGGFPCVFSMSALLTLLFGLYVTYFVLRRQFIISEKKLDFFKGFFNIKVIMNCLLTTFIYATFCFISPSFETHIVITLGQTPIIASSIMGTHIIGVVLSLIIILNIDFEKYGKKIIFFGAAVSVSCEFFIGPEPLLNITETTSQLVAIAIAMFVLGASNGLCIILIMREFHLAYHEIFPDDDEINKNLANGAYLASFGSGEFFGVLLGGVIVDNVGFQRGNSYFGLGFLAFYLFYVAWSWKVDKNYAKLNEETEA